MSETRAQRDIRITQKDNPTLSGAELIVEALDRDISDRRGLKWEWEKIDSDVMEELKAHWVEIIKEALGNERIESFHAGYTSKETCIDDLKWLWDKAVCWKGVFENETGDVDEETQKRFSEIKQRLKL